MFKINKHSILLYVYIYLICLLMFTLYLRRLIQYQYWQPVKHLTDLCLLIIGFLRQNCLQKNINDCDCDNLTNYAMHI
jgi:hypothetical protein